MKILFNCSLPFPLTHGGQQIQIEQTMEALRSIGVAVEPFRWWDGTQIGDLIHYFGRIPAVQVELAHQKGIKIVMAELLTGQGSRSKSQLLAQKLFTGAIQRFAPRMISGAFNWESYQTADALIALTGWEKHLMSYTFGAPPEKISVVGNGVEEVFFQSPTLTRREWLVCTATITERKRVLELAEAAVEAKTPVWIIGKAYSDSDPYAQKFVELTRENPAMLRYEGAIQDRTKMASIYREARGFVLLSTMESLSLSALEASACECPLLLSDLPWARSTFGDAAQYCPITNSVSKTATALRAFYDAAPSLPCPPKPPTWIDIAKQLKAIYEKVLATP